MAANDGRIATGDWALLGLLSVLWGGSFCFNGVVLKELPPLTVVFVRVVLASLMILRGSDFGLHDAHAVGILLCLAAAFSYGISALLGRRMLTTSPPLATATFQMLASSVLLAILSLSIEQPWRLPMPSATTVLAIVGLAALSTALAYLVFFQVLQRSGATNVVLV